MSTHKHKWLDWKGSTGLGSLGSRCKHCGLLREMREGVDGLYHHYLRSGGSWQRGNPPNCTRPTSQMEDHLKQLLRDLMKANQALRNSGEPIRSLRMAEEDLNVYLGSKLPKLIIEERVEPEQ